jgi:adhesin transport system outer membrane protein
MKRWTLIVPAGTLLLSATPALSVDLREAIQSALTTNPEIRQAVSNRAATAEELNQGRAQWYPKISVEGSAGYRSLRNPTRRNIGIAGDDLWPVEGDLIVNQRASPGTFRICRAQRRAELHRLSASAAARRDRRRQCDFSREAGG